MDSWHCIRVGSCQFCHNVDALLRLGQEQGGDSARREREHWLFQSSSLNHCFLFFRFSLYFETAVVFF